MGFPIPILSVVLLWVQIIATRAEEDGIRALPKVRGVNGIKAATSIPLGCTQYASLVDACDSSTTNFFSLKDSVVASCLCYSSSNWLPSFFDNAVGECASWAKTADTTDYSDLHALESFCTHQGNVIAPQTTAVSTTSTGSGLGGSGSERATITSAPKPATSGTATATALTGPITACASLESAISSCEAATSDWIDLSGSAQASCICYSGTTWHPEIFDGEVKTCAGFLSTATPSVYSDFASLQNFCTKKGDVRANTAVTVTALSTGGSATRSVVIVKSDPATPSIGSSEQSSSSSSSSSVRSSSRAATTTSSGPATILVTVQPSSTAAATTAGGAALQIIGGNQVWLGFGTAVVMLGMLVLT